MGVRVDVLVGAGVGVSVGIGVSDGIGVAVGVGINVAGRTAVGVVLTSTSGSATSLFTLLASRTTNPDSAFAESFSAFLTVRLTSSLPSIGVGVKVGNGVRVGAIPPSSPHPLSNNISVVAMNGIAVLR